MRKNYNAIDLVKFIFAIIVVMIHTYPFFEVNLNLNFTISNIIGRIVIPFYFISAGYFLEKGKAKSDENYFKKYMWRLVKLYLLWSIISLPAGFLLLKEIMDVNTSVGILGLLVGLFYAGTYYHLWYMAALIFSIFVCHIFLKRFRLKYLLIISAILYGFGLLETYYQLTQLLPIYKIVNWYFAIFVTTRNGIFFGLLFVSLGIAIGRYDLNLKIKKPLIWVILLFGVLVVEALLVRHFELAIDYNMYLINLPLMYCFFCWLLNCDLKWHLNYRSLREYSTLIYFSHGMFLEYIPYFLGNNYVYLWSNGLFRFTSVLFLTLLTSFIVKRYIPLLK